MSEMNLEDHKRVAEISRLADEFSEKLFKTLREYITGLESKGVDIKVGLPAIYTGVTRLFIAVSAGLQSVGVEGVLMRDVSDSLEIVELEKQYKEEDDGTERTS